MLVAFGGVIGLCLGGSLLSIVEIFYYMTIGLYWTVKRAKSINNRVQNVQNIKRQQNSKLNYNRFEFLT